LSRELINVGIAGTGTYVPERVLYNSQLEELVDTSDEWIRSRSGIRERRIARPDQATSDLAVAAGERALENAGIAPEEVDLIITATNTPDMFFPATACLVQEKLGAKNAGAFDLAAGCTGFIYALATGSQFITTGSCRTVLVIGAENLSKITNWKDRNTCVLFGDGAGAVVLRPTVADRCILSFKLRADGAGALHLHMPAGGSRQPATRETVEQNKHYIHMNGREVFKFAVRVMGEAAEEVLALAGLSLPMEKVLVNVDRYGNTSTASIPLALEEALQSGRIKKGDNVVMVGFGAGLTWGAVAIKW